MNVGYVQWPSLGIGEGGKQCFPVLDNTHYIFYRSKFEFSGMIFKICFIFPSHNKFLLFFIPGIVVGTWSDDVTPIMSWASLKALARTRKGKN